MDPFDELHMMVSALPVHQADAERLEQAEQALNSGWLGWFSTVPLVLAEGG
jgi:hypothetical protein